MGFVVDFWSEFRSKGKGVYILEQIYDDSAA